MYFLEGLKGFSSGEGARGVRREEHGGMVVKRGFRGRGGETGVQGGVRGQVVNYPDRHHQLLRPRVPVRTCGLALRSLTLQIVLFFCISSRF